MNGVGVGVRKGRKGEHGKQEGEAGKRAEKGGRKGPKGRRKGSRERGTKGQDSVKWRRRVRCGLMGEAEEL